MAALLPTITSDDDDDDDEDGSSSTARVEVGGGDNRRRRRRRAMTGAADDDDDEDDEMDEDLEFGGLLAKDGSGAAFLDGRYSGGASSSWSYRSALSLLSRNDSGDDGTTMMVAERTSVASIIAAARSNLRRGVDDEDDVKNDKGEDKKEDGAKAREEDDDGSDDDDDDDDDDSDDDDSDDSSDDGVDDADHATNSMESDVLRVQERQRHPQRKGKKEEDGKSMGGGSATSSWEERVEKEGTRDESDEDDDNDDDDDDEDPERDDDDNDDDDEDERREAAKAAAFFDSSSGVVVAPSSDAPSRIDSFSMLGISRPLLRGVASMGFVSPTPIQSSVVPVALAGRDVCASAVTGILKRRDPSKLFGVETFGTSRAYAPTLLSLATAAFLLPIMERILQRGGGRATSSVRPIAGGRTSSATRALILAPTRELAAQCVSMMTAMAKFTDLRAALIVGGAKNVMSQRDSTGADDDDACRSNIHAAAELRTRPDVVVATPGRLLDHIANSQGVDMDDVEFLVLDEADRLLDLGFQDEVHEIVKSCPAERQTMLFSATMSTKVDDLIRLSLKRPVRISATDKERTGRPAGSNNGVEVAPRLEQEFVRVRAGNEGANREGMLLALLTRTFRDRVIVFFDTKSAAHRLMIVCGLCGIKCAELHGNLTQVQRLEALEAFREGSVDVLLCTDLAARGLDITGVEAVINFEMPSQVETYVHRIGRTARAGRGGKSCTLIGEGRRYLMKEVIKDADEKNRRQKQDRSSQPIGVIRSRTIPPAVIAHFVAKINSLERTINEVMDAETVARLDRIAEMEAVRVKNIIEHSDSIKSRPQKEWFATPKEKMSVKAATAERKRLMEEKVGTGTHRMTRKKRRAQEAREMFLEAKEEAAKKEEETGKKSKKDRLERRRGKMQSGRRSWRPEASMTTINEGIGSLNKNERQQIQTLQAMGDYSRKK
ncbi:hypothetical protein ACHAW5_006139 [Stephanodiscus triporus]|uniref:RNA helicase n=1 Tax=Stephanodiscus triporus TaxID=2934178 RepID=A0ABD3MN03_9STRA